MRMIDADALEKVLNEKFQTHYGRSVYQFIHDFSRCCIRLIRKAPTIDAVVVCRCKDCKHYRTETAMTFVRNGAHIRCCDCDNVSRLMRDDDFCSYGERRGDGNEV